MRWKQKGQIHKGARKSTRAWGLSTAVHALHLSGAYWSVRSSGLGRIRWIEAAIGITHLLASTFVRGQAFHVMRTPSIPSTSVWAISAEAISDSDDQQSKSQKLLPFLRMLEEIQVNWGDPERNCAVRSKTPEEMTKKRSQDKGQRGEGRSP